MHDLPTGSPPSSPSPSNMSNTVPSTIPPISPDTDDYNNISSDIVPHRMQPIKQCTSFNKPLPLAPDSRTRNSTIEELLSLHSLSPSEPLLPARPRYDASILQNHALPAPPLFVAFLAQESRASGMLKNFSNAFVGFGAAF